jgi:homoserine dehydrogenase
MTASIITETKTSATCCFTPSAPPTARVVVLKFGGSVLHDEREVEQCAREVDRWNRAGWKVVAVVSALDGTTDRLIQQASRLSHAPDATATALLLSTGELAAAALLALALTEQETKACVLTPRQISLLTAGEPQDSLAISVDAGLIRSRLEALDCVVVPGFVGVDEFGATTLLGRGGSDLTALFLARNLGASCRLVKDVDGLYERDPAKDSSARRFDKASYDTALRLSGTVGAIVQSKAVQYAIANGLEFEVGAVGRADGTLVSAAADELVQARELATALAI